MRNVRVKNQPCVNFRSSFFKKGFYIQLIKKVIYGKTIIHKVRMLKMGDLHLLLTFIGIAINIFVANILNLIFMHS